MQITIQTYMKKYKIRGIQRILLLYNFKRCWSTLVFGPSRVRGLGKRTVIPTPLVAVGYRAMDRRETRYRVTDRKDTFLYSLS